MSRRKKSRKKGVLEARKEREKEGTSEQRNKGRKSFEGRKGREAKN